MSVYQSKGQIPVRAIVSRAPDLSGNFVTDGTDGGAVLNDALNYIVNTFGGGALKIRGAIYVDDEDVVTPDADSALIIEGEGCAHNADTVAGAQFSSSYIRISGGFNWTNNLVAWMQGRLILRDLGLIFVSVTANEPMLLTDYHLIGLEDVLIWESGNTVTDYTDPVIGNSSSTPPTPPGGYCYVINSRMKLNSANATGFFLHNEPWYVQGLNLDFNGDDQIGIEVAGVTCHRVDSLHTWLGAAAEGCKVFELFNEGKTVVIDNLTGSTQAGAGLTTPNIMFAHRAGTWTNTNINIMIHGCVEASCNWGVTPAAPIYLWEDADVQERTQFATGSGFQKVPVNPHQPYQFILDSTAENVATPGVSPGAAFAANLDQDVDLQLVSHARVLVRAQGDEAGNNKGVLIYNEDDASILCDTGTWAGNAVTYAEGLWTNVLVNAWKNCNAYGYSDSGTESLDCWIAKLELR